MQVHDPDLVRPGRPRQPGRRRGRRERRRFRVTGSGARAWSGHGERDEGYGGQAADGSGLPQQNSPSRVRSRCSTPKRSWSAIPRSSRSPAARATLLPPKSQVGLAPHADPASVIAPAPKRMASTSIETSEHSRLRTIDRTHEPGAPAGLDEGSGGRAEGIVLRTPPAPRSRRPGSRTARAPSSGAQDGKWAGAMTGPMSPTPA